MSSQRSWERVSIADVRRRPAGRAGRGRKMLYDFNAEMMPRSLRSGELVRLPDLPRARKPRVRRAQPLDLRHRPRAPRPAHRTQLHQSPTTARACSMVMPAPVSDCTARESVATSAARGIVSETFTPSASDSWSPMMVAIGSTVPTVI